MKKFIVILVALSTSVAFQSCNQDDDSFGFRDLIGTYVGAMNVQNPDFTNAQYSVQVSQVSSQVIKITPLGTAGTEWTAHMTNVAGVWTCISCVTNNQVTITEISGSVQLSYNYDSNEQFAGVKQ